MELVTQDYELVSVDKLAVHPKNPRRGDVLGLTHSVAANGFYGALVVQRSTGFVLAGNHRLLAAKAQGASEVPVIYVDVDDDRAQRILLVDNRSNDVATYDEEQLAELLGTLGETQEGLVGTGYSEDDLAALLAGEDAGDDAGAEEDKARSDGSLLDLADVTVADPTHLVRHGEVWRLGVHVLVVAKVHTEWELWQPHLRPGALFVPYPGPYTAMTEKALATPLVMVQPDPYLAGHVLDKWAAAQPDALPTLEAAA